MASRVAEVIYRLRDLFTKPARGITNAYDRLRDSSKRAADSVERDNQRISGSFAAVSRGIRTAVGAIGGLFAGRAVVGGISSVADELDRLGKTADRLQIDPNTLSALEFAAERSGIAVSKASAAIETLQKRSGEALQGIGQARRAFDALNISVEQFVELDAEQQLILIADRLQGVASEEERAALAAQLFSRANVDLLNVLNGGGQALRELIERGKEYRTVTVEATKAAAAYNDALSNLGRQVDAIKFDIFTPAVQQLSEFLDNIGQGDQLKGLTTELLLLEQRLEKAFVFDRRGVERRVDEIRSTLRRLANEREAAAAASEKETAAAKAAAEEQRFVKEALQDLNQEQKERVRTLKETLRAETQERETALREQARIENEFRRLREDIARPEAVDVTLGDVSLKQREAAAALTRGEAEDAVRLAREGGDLLSQLKDNGTESQLVLEFFAKQLERVAKAAAAQDVETEILDAEKIKQQVETAEAQLKELTEKMKAEGGRAGRAWVDEFTAAIRDVTIPAPQIEAPSLPLPDVVREGIESYRRELDKRGTK